MDIRIFSNLHLFHENRYYYSQFGNIKATKMLRYPKNKFNVFDFFYDLYCRLFRGGIHNILVYKNKIIIIVKKKIVIFEKEKKACTIRIDNGSKPLRQGVIIKNNKLIYGDYYGNKKRRPVHVYELDLDTYRKNILLTFDKVRHVHLIQRDENNKDVFYIGTGDRDEESYIYKYDYNNKELKVIGGGSQRWRAVSVLQHNNCLIWGSDCPYKQNYIFYYDLLANKIKKTSKIGGPAYYSTKSLNGKMFIATTVEDRKIHRACIYGSKDGYAWEELYEFQKDMFNEKYFGYGMIEFINGQERLEELYVSLRGLKWIR